MFLKHNSVVSSKELLICYAGITELKISSSECIVLSHKDLLMLNGLSYINSLKIAYVLTFCPQTQPLGESKFL